MSGSTSNERQESALRGSPQDGNDRDESLVAEVLACLALVTLSVRPALPVFQVMIDVVELVLMLIALVVVLTLAPWDW